MMTYASERFKILSPTGHFLPIYMPLYDKLSQHQAARVSLLSINHSCNRTSTQQTIIQKKMNVSKAMNSTYGMSRTTYDQARKTPMKLLPGPSTLVDRTPPSKQSKVESALSTMNKIAKGKLSLGAKILQLGGVEKVFRRVFSVRQGEQLLKASQCCLSTTAGPVAGRLFISTDKLAFCSDKPIMKYASPSGEMLRFHYKVVIPLTKIKRANQCENVKKPSQKYLNVVTTDDYEFWFMGFLNYKRTFKSLQQAVQQHN